MIVLSLIKIYPSLSLGTYVVLYGTGIAFPGLMQGLVLMDASPTRTGKQDHLIFLSPTRFVDFSARAL